MKIIQLISMNLEMKNVGIIVYGRFPTEKLMVHTLLIQLMDF